MPQHKPPIIIGSGSCFIRAYEKLKLLNRPRGGNQLRTTYRYKGLALGRIRVVDADSTDVLYQNLNGENCEIKIRLAVGGSANGGSTRSGSAYVLSVKASDDRRDLFIDTPKKFKESVKPLKRGEIGSDEDIRFRYEHPEKDVRFEDVQVLDSQSKEVLFRTTSRGEGYAVMLWKRLPHKH